jgi:DNA (cytosine-5)-methyltransferase 1
MNITKAVRMLPTPRAQEPGSTSEGYGNGLRETVRMLPTPTVSDTFTGNLKSTQQKPGSMHSVTLPQAAQMDWEQFKPAIRRWESTIGRAAPAPLIDNRLNPKFIEWLMGLPEGWITDLDISWTQMIKACGNGVVPQQAKLALERLIP